MGGLPSPKLTCFPTGSSASNQRRASHGDPRVSALVSSLSPESMSVSPLDGMRSSSDPLHSLSQVCVLLQVAPMRQNSLR